MQLQLNFLEHREVCGFCHKVNDQSSLEPCSSESCQGDEKGMFHTRCMVHICKDLYQCKVLDVDSGEDEGEDSGGPSDEEAGPMQALEYGLLKVGDSYGKGIILEIFPDIDKVTVAVVHGQGTEIQHWKLTKILSKMHAKQPGTLDSMD